MAMLRSLKILLLQFAAFTFGKQIMITERTISHPKPPDKQAERDRCITAILEAVECGDEEAARSQARVFLSLPMPHWEDYQGDSMHTSLMWSYHMQEWMTFRKLAEEWQAEDDHA